MADPIEQALANTAQGNVDISHREHIIPLVPRSGGQSRVGSTVDPFKVAYDPFETKRSVQEHVAGQGGRTP